MSQGQCALPAIETEALVQQQIRHYLYQQHHVTLVYRRNRESNLCQRLYGGKFTECRPGREWLACVSNEWAWLKQLTSRLNCFCQLLISLALVLLSLVSLALVSLQIVS